MNPCEKARADKHSPSLTQRVDVPFVDLFLDVTAAMDTMRVYLLAAAFLLPTVSSLHAGVRPRALVHVERRGTFVSAPYQSLFFFFLT